MLTPLLVEVLPIMFQMPGTASFQVGRSCCNPHNTATVFSGSRGRSRGRSLHLAGVDSVAMMVLSALSKAGTRRSPTRHMVPVSPRTRSSTRSRLDPCRNPQGYSCLPAFGALLPWCAPQGGARSAQWPQPKIGQPRACAGIILQGRKGKGVLILATVQVRPLSPEWAFVLTTRGCGGHLFDLARRFGDFQEN